MFCITADILTVVSTKWFLFYFIFVNKCDLWQSVMSILIVWCCILTSDISLRRKNPEASLLDRFVQWSSYIFVRITVKQIKLGSFSSRSISIPRCLDTCYLLETERTGNRLVLLFNQSGITCYDAFSRAWSVFCSDLVHYCVKWLFWFLKHSWKCRNRREKF